MKILLATLILILSTSTFASDAQIIISMLNSENVKSKLKGKDIKSIYFSKENLSTSWSYRAQIQTNRFNLDADGVDIHSCFVNVEIVSMGEFTGTETSNPTVSTACAKNKKILF